MAPRGSDVGEGRGDRAARFATTLQGCQNGAAVAVACNWAKGPKGLASSLSHLTGVSLSLRAREAAAVQERRLHELAFQSEVAVQRVRL